MEWHKHMSHANDRDDEQSQKVRFTKASTVWLEIESHVPQFSRKLVWTDLILHRRENKWKQHLMIFAEKRLDCRFRTRIMEPSRELKIGANSAEFWFQGQVGHALTSTFFFQGRNVKWRCDWRAMMMPQKPSWSTESRRHLGLVRYFGVCGWWIVGLVWLDVNQYL